MIYFLLHRPSQSVKIGVTTVLLRRLVSLACAYPVLEDYQLLGTLDGGAEEEHAFHVEFGDHHIRAEWFKVSGALQTYLEQFKSPRSLADILPVIRGFGRKRTRFWRLVTPESIKEHISGRYQKIALRYQAGETMRQIAVGEHCSRQRIHQILQVCESFVWSPAAFLEAS